MWYVATSYLHQITMRVVAASIVLIVVGRRRNGSDSSGLEPISCQTFHKLCWTTHNENCGCKVRYNEFVSPKKEYLPLPEISPVFVERYAYSFISRRDCYPMQMADGSYRTIYEELTTPMLIQHIRGKITLGAYALNEQSQAHWLCLDADDDTEWAKLWQLAKQLEEQGLTPYLETSRRGGHLWLFTPTISGQIIRQFGLQFIKAHGLDGIELYPKQDQLTTGVGSLLRLPLGIHRKSGQRYYFITTEGRPLAPSIREQMAVLSNPKRIPLEYIKQLLSQIESPPPLKPSFERIARQDGATLSERIKRSISVVDFVRPYVELDTRNRGLCPFHDDHHQSFQVHDTKNFWHCYAGCGGGSLIDFWMKWREAHGQDASFVATITELAQMLFG